MANKEIKVAVISLFAGASLVAFPLGLVIKHKDRQVVALAEFANQILDKTASAMELCVAQRDAARKTATTPHTAAGYLAGRGR